MDRARWLAEKHEEIARLGSVRVSEVTPSRRDFALFVATQRQELAVIARIQRVDPDHHRSWRERDFVEFAGACDDAEVAALAVATDQQRDGALKLLRAVVEGTSAPVLRDDLILDVNQLYDARLHGADAAVFPANELNGSALTELARVASSLHMASVIEVLSAADLLTALAVGKTLIGINAELDETIELSRAVPANRTVIALRDSVAIDEARRLRGHVDAVVIGPLLLDSTNIVATLAAIGHSE